MAINVVLDRIAAQQKDRKDIYDSIYQASAEMAAAANQPQIVTTTGETAMSLAVKKQGELEAQNKKQKIAQASNFDELSITLGQDLAALASQQREVTAKIQKDSSVSLFDDPLLAIANAFTLPWDEQKLDGITQKMEVTSKSMQAINSHVQQSAATAEAVKTTVTEASIADIAKATEAVAIAKSAEARLNAAKSNAQVLDDILRLDEKRSDAYLRNQQIADAAESRAMRRLQFEEAQKLHAKQMEVYAEKDQADAYQLELANTALIANGKNPIDIKGFKNFKLTSAKFLDSLVEHGLKVKVNGRDNYSHGDTIVEALNWRDTIGWTPETPQQREIISQQRKAIEEAANTQIKDKKTGAVIGLANAEDVFAAKFKSGQALIEGADSVFAAPAWGVLAAENPTITNNVIWKDYLAPSLAAGDTIKQSASYSLAQEAARKAVADGKISSGQAATYVSHLFKQAVNINNTVHKFELLTGKKQTVYGVRTQTGLTPLYGMETINALDSTQVQAAIQASMISTLNPIKNAIGAFQLHNADIKNAPASRTSTGVIK